MNEINKPNDILVSTILNPNATVVDLLANGINETNTGIYDKDVYRNSDFIKNTFTNKDGVFDDGAFNKAYDQALEQYNQLSAVQTYEQLQPYISYNPNDLYAPINSNKSAPSYTIERVRNPFRTSMGVKGLFTEGESDKSNRELAQQHKVWDTENQKWLDYTAEDQGFMGIKYLGRPALVYATYDEDGTHFDKALGRNVEHRKGEWKTDENGEFYTETAGNRELYGKQFVAYSDVLTKEDSWLNKIDFFDSDDKEKSTAGKIAKIIAAIAPYMVPIVREAWGGFTAAVALASVAPTFAKMVEGIVAGDQNTAFTRSMNTMENYFSKFDKSYDDESMTSNFNFAKMADTVADIFGQLYQMRAAASLSKLFMNQTKKAQKESFANFVEKFGNDFTAVAKKNPSVFKNPEKDFVKMWEEVLDQTPEMKALIKRQSKLSQSLSLGYMALTSSADVYADALDGGFDRRMAGFAGLTAALGQYGIMMNNPMGNWFLDATTGYSKNVNRNLMKKALRPYYDKIAEGVDKMAKAKTQEEKLNWFAKTIGTVWNGSRKGLTSFWSIIRDGGEEFWKRSIIEGVEEVTEEAVMDATKGAFDFLSWLGVGKNKGASFDTIGNTFSQEGLERYLMNLIGGLMGGALFELQGKVIQPAIDAAVTGTAKEEVTTSLIKEIRNGNTSELLRLADAMGKSDKSTIEIIGTEEVTTRGTKVSQELKNYIKFVEGIVVDNNLELTDEQVLKKAVRDRIMEPLLNESGVTDVLIDDFNKATADLAELQSKINLATAANEDNEKSSDNIKELQNQFKAKKQELEAFLNGENTEHYVQMALQYLIPSIRSSVFNSSIYDFAKSKYGVDYATLEEDASGISKKKIQQEYNEWKKSDDNFNKFKTIGVDAYNELQKDFSSVIFDYAQSAYKDIRKQVLENFIRKEGFTLGSDSKNQNWREVLGNLTKVLYEAKAATEGDTTKRLPGATLEELLDYGDGIKQNLANQIEGISQQYLETILPAINEQQKDIAKMLPEGTELPELNVEDLRNTFVNTLISTLNKYPVEKLNQTAVTSAIFEANKTLAAGFVNSITATNPDMDVKTLKSLIDQKLTELGFSTDDKIEFETKEDAYDYVNAQTIPNIDADTDLDFKYPILEAYINNNDQLDGEIVRLLKKSVFDQYPVFQQLISDLVMDKYSMFPNPEDEDEVAGLIINEDNLELFKTHLYEGLNKNLTIEQIVDNWINDPKNGIVDEYEKPIIDANRGLENFRNELIKELSKNRYVELYNTAQAKNQLQNPFYEFLRNYGMRVFDGQDMTLFDLLQQESAFLSSLPNALDYIRQGVTKESIDNFLSKLDLLDAVIVGTEDTPIDSENLFSYNNQLRRYKEKWEGGKDADKYATVSVENVQSMHADLQLLKNKLEFLKNLIEMNTESKREENRKAQVKIEELLLDWVNDHSSDLTYGTVSLLPSKEELNSKKTNTEKLALVKHTIYQKAKEVMDGGVKVTDFINTLYDQLKINAEAIFKDSLRSNGIGSDVKSISEYDLFVFITSALATDSYEFYYKYKEALSDENYKKVPFFTQEYAIETAYSFIADNRGIHNTAVNYLYNKNKGLGYQKASHLFFVEGIAGAGKTSAVMAMVKQLAQIENIWVAAPKEAQLENLLSALQVKSDTPNFTKLKLLQQILTDEGYAALEKAIQDPENSEILKKIEEGPYIAWTANIDPKYIRDIKDAPRAIFIDEITHFELAELVALEVFASKYGTKIITSGDTLQKGSTQVGFNIESIFSFKNPRLLISARTSRDTKKDNLTILRTVLESCQNEYKTSGFSNSNAKAQKILVEDLKQLKYYQEGDSFSGDKLVKEITVDDLKMLKKAAEGKTIAVLTILDAEGNIANGGLVTKLKDAGITNYQAYSLDPTHAKSVQGLEADYVIIDDNRGDAIYPSSDYDALIDVYTYLSRSLIGTLVHMPDVYAQKLKLESIKVKTNGDYSLPGLDEQQDLKKARIDELANILQDFKPEEPKAEESTETSTGGKKPPTKTKTEEKSKPTPVKEERKKRTATSTPPTADDTWTPKGLYGYGFYENLGVKHTASGDLIAVNYGHGIDLDGLFKEGDVIAKSYINGYVRLKRLISLYPDASTEEWKDGLKDSYILDFLWKANPAISSEKNEDLRREEVYDWAIDNLQVSNKSYIIAKEFSEFTDRPYQLDTENTKDEVKKGQTILFYGRKLTSKDGAINQYVTNGTFPRISTLQANKIKFDSYEKLYQEASEKIKDLIEKKQTPIVVYEIDSVKIESPVKVTLYNTKNGEDSNFTSLRQLQNGRNVIFDENKIYLINQERCTVNGIESFAILHYIAQNEESSIKDYQKRIEQLEGIFTKDGKLTIGGKYFTWVSFINSQNKKDQRVLILEPGSFTYEAAIGYQHTLIGKQKNDDSESLLDLKASAMSQASQIYLLQDMFTRMTNYINAKKGPMEETIDITTVIKDCVDYVSKKVKNPTLRQKADALIKLYTAENKAFDMNFVSDLLRETRYYGVLLIDQFTTFHKASERKAAEVGIKLIEKAETTAREEIDWDFDLGQLSYMEFYTNPDYALEYDGQPDKPIKFYKVVMKDNKSGHINTIDHIGVINQSIQMPKVGFIKEILEGRKQIDKPLLTRTAVDRTNDDGKAEKKPKSSTATFEEMSKLFDPSTRKYPTPSGRMDSRNKFYKFVKMSNKDQQRRIKSYTININGYSIRPGDTVELFGDTSRNYYISFIDKKHNNLVKITKINGKESKEKWVEPQYISNVISRELVKPYDKAKRKDAEVFKRQQIQKDYYQSEEYKKKVKPTTNDKIKDLENYSETELDSILTRGGKPVEVIILLPVRDGDSSVAAAIETDGDTENPTLNSNFIITKGKDTDTIHEEIVEKLSSLKQNYEDLDGIAVITLTTEGISSGLASSPDAQKKVLKTIKQSYVAHYLAKDPKHNKLFEDKTASKTERGAAKTKSSGKTEKREKPQKKSETSAIDKIIQNAKTYEDIVNEINRTQTEVPKQGFFDGQLPKMSYLKKHFDDATIQRLIDSTKELKLAVGDTIEVFYDNLSERDDEGKPVSYKVTVKSIDGENVIATNANGAEYTLNMGDLRLLNGFKYTIGEETDNKSDGVKESSSAYERVFPGEKLVDHAQKVLGLTASNYIELYDTLVNDTQKRWTTTQPLRVKALDRLILAYYKVNGREADLFRLSRQFIYTDLNKVIDLLIDDPTTAVEDLIELSIEEWEKEREDEETNNDDCLSF